MLKKILLLVSIPFVWWLSIAGLITLCSVKTESALLFSLMVVSGMMLILFMWIYTFIAAELIRD